MSVTAGDLDTIINESRDAREVKRALSVKMALSAIAVSQICELLNVSAAFVSKWRGIYQAQSGAGLALGYAGTQGYLEPEQKSEVIAWLQAQAAPSVAGVRDYVEESYGVVYQSQQSYYELMQAAGLSYHKSEKVNPKRDAEQVQQRRQEIKKNWRSTGKR